ncbi:MAG TPA: hypothetical protein VN959_16215, partial [Mycobacterium sp.]|nr:hypothetical protein [Mycobacterium sp.]
TAEQLLKMQGPGAWPNTFVPGSSGPAAPGAPGAPALGLCGGPPNAPGPRPCLGDIPPMGGGGLPGQGGGMPLAVAVLWSISPPALAKLPLVATAGLGGYRTRPPPG